MYGILFYIEEVEPRELNAEQDTCNARFVGETF